MEKKAVGIICEYNPFHNGHLYHLQKVQELFPEETIILVMTGCFTQRGEPSLISKWDKTDIALHYGVDLVVELPFVFGTQSADTFAKASIILLDALKVSHLVFGTESNDIDSLTKMADFQLHNPLYKEEVKDLLKSGINYPTAMAKALENLSSKKIEKPNDLLGLSYIKAIQEIHSSIIPVSIQRTHDYHNLKLEGSLASASAIRKALQENKDISAFVPSYSLSHLQNPVFIEKYFPFLKYKIYTETPFLKKYKTVDEGLDDRIEKNINKSDSYESFIQNVKTKRYTYNKLSRMCTHILCNFTKEEGKEIQVPTYIRILGFSSKGRSYLKQIKKTVKLPIITRFGDIKSPILDLEMRATKVYASVLPETDKTALIEKEYQSPPIYKDLQNILERKEI